MKSKQILSLSQKIKSKLFLQAKDRYKICSGDRFIVSYPKSGNTWLRFILANLIKEEDETIDFHNAVNYIPEIGTHDDVLANLPRPRIIKSHTLYNQNYPQVIYLVRDPRDVYVSYYHYLKKRLPENTSFSEFLRLPNLHPSRWQTHVNSWLDSPNLLLVVKYENLLVDTAEEVSKITDILFAEKVCLSRINTAIENSSLDKMKKVEQEKGRPFKSEAKAKKSTTFVRKGIQGDWVNYFSQEDEDFILSEAGNTMKRLNYI